LALYQWSIAISLLFDVKEVNCCTKASNAEKDANYDSCYGTSAESGFTFPLIRDDGAVASAARRLPVGSV
jgi:hypothetical protein